MTEAYQFEVRRVSAEETRPLRHKVLRAHQRIEEVGFAGDSVIGAAHFGAWRSGELVAVATVHPEGEPGWWRLRGVATDEAHRGRGLGAALVGAVVRYVADEGGLVVWCNARVPAAEFYRRHGFIAEGAQFESPGTGPHFYMVRWLSAK